MTATPCMTDQDVIVRIVGGRALDPTVCLEVDYEGTCPPTDLFADLTMVGWEPPTPASPPAKAIDWQSSDGNGNAPRIRPWRVRGATARPPVGSGPRGRWTAEEREAFLVALRGVLARHGIAMDDEPQSAVQPPVHSPHPPTTEPSVPPAGTGYFTVTVVAEPELQSRTWLALNTSASDEPTISTGEIETVNTYRGSEYVATRPAAVISAPVASEHLDSAVSATCAAAGLRAEDKDRVRIEPHVGVGSADVVDPR